jgi:hypothetical protein
LLLPGGCGKLRYGGKSDHLSALVA